MTGRVTERGSALCQFEIQRDELGNELESLVVWVEPKSVPPLYAEPCGCKSSFRLDDESLNLARKTYTGKTGRPVGASDSNRYVCVHMGRLVE